MKRHDVKRPKGQLLACRFFKANRTNPKDLRLRMI